ncbi:MAG: carboxypeptidase-like regulatory domain-containing protein [Bacteroidales bacterium]
MLRKLLFTFGIILSANLLVFSQSGVLKGKVLDKDTREPLPFVNIVVEVGGTNVGGSASDFDGNFMIKPIPPGKYDVKATYVGYKPTMYKGVAIAADNIQFLDIEMESTAQMLTEFEVKEYAVPLISKDQTTSGASVTSEEIAKMPNRSANSIASTVGGVFSADGERGRVRGAREDATVMYIDGIRVRGYSNLPASSIEQVDVVLGGVPAQYGDATGGIINVTTKGPSRNFGAGMELETSEFLDPFGYNRVGLNINGPLFSKKDENGKRTTSLLGFFIAGDFNYNRDGRPIGTDFYKAKDDYLKYLEVNPLRPAAEGAGTYANVLYTEKGDLEKIKTTQNTSNYDINLTGKIDIRTTETINLTFGGSYYALSSNNFDYANSLFNYDKNQHQVRNTWRVFGRFTQRFPSDKESTSLIKNVYYSIQADYTRDGGYNEDADHQQDLFKYGYLGKYTTYKMPTYQIGSDTVNGNYYDQAWQLNSWDFDTLVTFDPFNFNPLIANYTTSYYDLFTGQPFGNYQNLGQIQLGGGLLNGQGPDNVYGLWAAPGALQSGYNEFDNAQFAVNVSGAMDIGNHEFKFGFQYDQRSDRGYGYAPAGFWGLMRLITNFHIRELDIENPFVVEGSNLDTIKYYRKYDEISQRTFDYNLRQKLGLPTDGLDFIDIDSYDFNTNSINYFDKDGVRHTINYGNEIFSVDMFSADELLNDGISPYVGYNGFDYKGNKLTSRPSFEDFFNKMDENGNYTREIGAYEPNYMAFYLQDKFAFRDLIFNVGLRADRFDANQQMLKDPFLIYQAYSVKEVQSVGGEPVDHPSNMGPDYVVYVDNVNNPTQIVGYRNEYDWFNASGAEILDPTTLDVGSGISPYLVDPTLERPTIAAFKDYEPQWAIMPRVAFSFPISDEALFFAHYDVLTQRPTNSVFADPSIYYFFNNVSGRINNPGLKPTKTIDYEVGFQQKLSNSSSVKLVTFYREMRDMLQVYRYTGAYPKDYTSYNNIDFGTVKGLTVQYDLRKTGNVRLSAYYTLQFADATGSSQTTTAALIASGVPNLRTTYPIQSDRRHSFNIFFDYHYGGGAEYNGPVSQRTKSGKPPVQWLSYFGITLTVNGGSGTPYTQSINVVGINQAGTNLVKGTYFGSRGPWQFRTDATIDKDFHFTMGNGENKREGIVNVYLRINNVLNARNILGVYSFTGNANDDGYLTAAESQKQISEAISEQAYRDLYSIAVNNPGNYSNPRSIHLGVIFNF